MDDNSNSSSLTLGQPFKSRFLKTERSSALLKEESESKSESGIRPLPPGSVRMFRSTFSPLAKLPENVELKAGNSSGSNTANNNGDQLSKNIQSFINRTDHVANEWKNLGTEKKRSGSTERRSGSVERGSFEGGIKFLRIRIFENIFSFYFCRC